MTHDPNCIFCKIVAGQIPSREDGELGFHDIAPGAGAFLVIPVGPHPDDVRDDQDHADDGQMFAAGAAAGANSASSTASTVVNTGRTGTRRSSTSLRARDGGPRPWLRG